MSGRIAATLPWPAAASDLNCFMTVKLLVNEVVEMLDGPLARTEAEAPPPTAPTSIDDTARESPPSMPALLKRTLSPLVLARPVKRTPPAVLLSLPRRRMGCRCSFVAASRTLQRTRSLCWAWPVEWTMPSEDARAQGQDPAAVGPGRGTGQPGVVAQGRRHDRQVGRDGARAGCSTSSRTGPKNSSCRPSPPPMTTVLG